MGLEGVRGEEGEVIVTSFSPVVVAATSGRAGSLSASPAARPVARALAAPRPRPAVNNLGTFGRWAFLEIDGSKLRKTKQEIRKLLKEHSAQ
jgi:hypothetical protein